MPPSSPKQKPGRRSAVAAHPRRAEIELACASGISLREIADRFGISRASVDRHWHSLPAEERAFLSAMATELAEHQAALSRVFAAAMARAGISHRTRHYDSEGHAHAA
ncbi:ECF-type sigma factor [Methylorubrum extorquens]|uniref:ECF-type sigma factor n=1 Tax=Methylorubrum extorquens TaxID=408 RepID=UPI003F5F7B9F